MCFDFLLGNIIWSTTTGLHKDKLCLGGVVLVFLLWHEWKGMYLDGTNATKNFHQQEVSQGGKWCGSGERERERETWGPGRLTKKLKTGSKYASQSIVNAHCPQNVGKTIANAKPRWDANKRATLSSETAALKQHPSPLLLGEGDSHIHILNMT